MESKMDASELLIFAVRQKASDVHISAGESPMIRIHGELRKLETPAMTSDQVHKMIYDILNDRQRKTLEETKELDFSIALGEYGRFRVNCFFQQRGEAAVFRSIPSKIYTFEELGLPRACRQIAKNRRGLVLVTGPTGSGKSTTLAAIVNQINHDRKEHIITIEDPIEFVHTSLNCMINQRELLAHTHSFANALRSALREDPDVILVGEMRDLETIQLALTAAETGHLVFATLHTTGAAKTIDRIIDVFPPEQQSQVRTQFSETIQAVISQRLFKRRDGSGRVAAVEVMIGTPAIRNLIREGKVSQISSIMQTGQKYGMQTMDAALKDLINRKIVAPEEAEGILDETLSM
jgi:twitching motility protein PilT